MVASLSAVYYSPLWQWEFDSINVWICKSKLGVLDSNTLSLSPLLSSSEWDYPLEYRVGASYCGCAPHGGAQLRERHSQKIYHYPEFQRGVFSPPPPPSMSKRRPTMIKLERSSGRFGDSFDRIAWLLCLTMIAVSSQTQWDATSANFKLFQTGTQGSRANRPTKVAGYSLNLTSKFWSLAMIPAREWAGARNFYPPRPIKQRRARNLCEQQQRARASTLYEDNIRWISLLSLTILSEELTRIFFSNVFMSRVKLQPKLTHMLAELLCVCLLNPSLQRLSSVGGGKHSMQFALQFNTWHGKHRSAIYSMVKIKCKFSVLFNIQILLSHPVDGVVSSQEGRMARKGWNTPTKHTTHEMRLEGCKKEGWLPWQRGCLLARLEEGEREANKGLLRWTRTKEFDFKRGKIASTEQIAPFDTQRQSISHCSTSEYTFKLVKDKLGQRGRLEFKG